MYNIGDLVVYGVHGVCRIAELEDRTVDGKRLRYYVLEPAGQAGTRFLVPTNNERAVSKIRPVLDRAALESLLHSPDVQADAWIVDENFRKQRYRELLTGGDRAALLQMVGTLYRRKKAQAALGRKLHLCDDHFLHDAQKLLESEFAMVLGLEPGRVGEYIRSAMQVES